MISIGIDAHKSRHVAVAVDDGARCVASGRARIAMKGGLTCCSGRRAWGVSAAGALKAPGTTAAVWPLLAAGEPVHEMNTRWTAKERRRARNQSKTDQRDAQAIALYVWREGATLPLMTTEAEDEAAVLEVLVTQRDAAVAEATRLRNQAHQLLLQCDPA